MTSEGKIIDLCRETKIKFRDLNARKEIEGKVGKYCIIKFLK